MNILVVSQYFWPESFRINDVAAGLVERGHNVTVLTGIPNYPDGRFFDGYGFGKNLRQDYCGVRVIRVPLMPRGKASGIKLALNYASFAAIASLLAPVVCRGQFDLIFVCQLSPVTVGIPAIVLKMIKKIPIFFWVQDIWPESLSATGAVKSEAVLRIVGCLVRFIYRHCDRILVQSPSFSTLIENQGVGRDRIVFYPNSVESVYKPAGRNVEAPANLPQGFKIMFAGNIGAAQDFETILSAAQRIKDYPDIHWVILGDGRRFEWVKEEIRKRNLGNTVHMLGRYPFELMPAFFAQADVMLVTLKQDPIFSLTIPAKCQSYMACGKPIMAALDGEGARLIADSGVGLSSPASDANALANSVVKFYKMPEKTRVEMGQQGKAYCDANFEREMLISKLECLMMESI